MYIKSWFNLLTLALFSPTLVAGPRAYLRVYRDAETPSKPKLGIGSVKVEPYSFEYKGIEKQVVREKFRLLNHGSAKSEDSAQGKFGVATGKITFINNLKNGFRLENNSCPSSDLKLTSSCTFEIVLSSLPLDSTDGGQLTIDYVIKSRGKHHRKAVISVFTKAPDAPQLVFQDQNNIPISQIDFGELPLGKSVNPIDVRLVNVGERTAQNIQLSGLSTPFAISRNDCGSLSPGKSCGLQITDLPLKPGVHAETLLATFESQTAATKLSVVDKVLDPPAYVAFVTSATYSANLGGLSNADRVCQNAAETAGLSGAFKVILSDSVTSVRDRLRFDSQRVVRNTRGETIALNGEKLFTENLLRPIDVDENGTPIHSAALQLAWTGSGESGQLDSQRVLGLHDCLKWTSSSDYRRAVLGNTSSTDKVEWLSAFTSSLTVQFCSGQNRLYCVSQDSNVEQMERFEAASGEDTGDIHLTWEYPSDVTGYRITRVLRSLGTTPPRCDDTLASKVTQEPAPFVSGEITDHTGAPGSVFSYSLCVYGDSEAIISSRFVRSVKAAGNINHADAHMVFVTSTRVSGRPSCVRIDQECQNRARAVGLDKSPDGKLIVWKAILSQDTIQDSREYLRDRIRVERTVYNIRGEFIAGNKDELFGHGPALPINVTERGDVLDGANQFVWTGASFHDSFSLESTGRHTCANWRSDSSTDSGGVGALNATGREWLFAANTIASGILGVRPCDEPNHLRCISQPTLSPIAIGNPHKENGRLMFATSRYSSGNLNGLDGADSLCQTLASQAKLLGNWKAVLSTEKQSARDRVATDARPIFNVRGDFLGVGHEYFKFESFPQGLIYDEFGNDPMQNASVFSGSSIWTGSDSSGELFFISSLAACNNWTTSNPSANGTAGNADFNGSSIMLHEFFGCHRLSRLACIQK